MGFKTGFPLLTLSMLLAFSGQAFALGLGEIQAESRLGEGLKVKIPLLLQPGEFAPAECFRIVKPEGDLPWLKNGVFSRRNSMLLLKSERPVVEPILQLAIQVNCGFDVQREYTLMLSPPVQGVMAPEPKGAEVSPSGGRRIREGETPASIAAELYPESQDSQRRFIRALIRANRHLGLKSSLGGQQPLPEGEFLSIPELPPPPPLLRPKSEAPLQRETRIQPRSAADSPSLPVLPALQGDRLVLSAGVGELQDAPLRLSHELGVIPGEQVSESLLLQRKLLRLEYRMMAFLENQAELAQLPPEDRLKALESVLGEIAPPAPATQAPAPKEPAQASSVAKAPVDGPKPAPEPEGSGLWLWLLGGAGLAGAGALAWREWQRRRQSREESGEAGDFHFSPSLLEPPKTEVDPFDELDAPFRPQPVRQVTPAPDSGFSHSVLDDIPVQEPLAPDLPVSPHMGPESRLDASVDEVFTHNPVMELAEIMLSFGRVKGAAQALKEYIDQNPKEALQPWVKLLEVYRLAGMQEEFEQLAKSLNENFNVELLRWSEMPKAGDPASVDFVLELVPHDETGGTPAPRPQSIEAMPHICERIQACWGTPQCMDYIQSLLRDNRGGARLGFPLQVVDELLFLSELLRHEEFQAPLAPDIDLGADHL